ncbi:unnamed protein product [Ilex paraguariensis]|uniref:Uncharacterized protein n=1 Tax=Ilex paraguariensis TaxID=185542 RepID=A0ABC8QXX1_9AQUA
MFVVDMRSKGALGEKFPSPTKEVDDLKVEVSTSKDETENIENQQDEYNQLYEECLKQNKMMFSLSIRLKMSEDDKKAVHVDLVKSKAHICGLEEAKKSLKDKLNLLESDCHGLVKSKKSLEFK